MKKIALALMAASAAMFGFGMVASAQTGYGEAMAITSGAPTNGNAYTVRYTNCIVGDTINFAQPQSTPASGTAPCVGVGGVSLGSVVGLILPQQAALGTATFTFANAPTPAGTYNGTGTSQLQRSPTLPFSFILGAQATTTTSSTAVATTIPATTTTVVAAAGPTAPAAVATTTAAVVAAAGPVAPSAGLPATGSNGIGSTTGIALGLLVSGLGLFIVAQVRRRQTPTSV